MPPGLQATAQSPRLRKAAQQIAANRGIGAAAVDAPVVAPAAGEAAEVASTVAKKASRLGTGWALAKGLGGGLLHVANLGMGGLWAIESAKEAYNAVMGEDFNDGSHTPGVYEAWKMDHKDNDARRLRQMWRDEVDEMIAKKQASRQGGTNGQ